MNQPANLIEHVAWRIKNQLQQTFPTATEIRVRVAKKSPPVSLPVDWVEVEV
jgi:dihydroneopterin aldolase